MGISANPNMGGSITAVRDNVGLTRAFGDLGMRLSRPAGTAFLPTREAKPGNSANLLGAQVR